MTQAMTMSGDQQIVKLLDELPGRVESRVLRPALKESIEIVVSAELSGAPENTGLLKKALGASKLKNYGGTLFITAGVRRGFKRAVVAKARGGLRALGKRASAAMADAPQQNPARYIGVVTSGRGALKTKNRSMLYDARSGQFFGRRVAAVPPNPFVSEAFSTAAQSAVDRFTTRVLAGIDAEART